MRNNTREKNYYATIDNLMEGFQLIGHDWRYLYVNETVVKHSKYKSKEELLGYTMMEKYPGIEHTPMFETLELCMTGRLCKVLENEFTYPDGSKGWFELRVEPVPDGIFILSVDISERKKAELEKAEYIKGLEEVIFMTSHRVRQPISQILGFSNLLDTAHASREELKQICGYMKRAVLALDNFTRELTQVIYQMKKKAEDQ